jgi:sugar phosphate isomerase/epimerase
MVEAALSSAIEGIDFRGIGTEIDTTKTIDFTDKITETLTLLKDKGIRMPCLNTSVILVTPAQDRWETMLEECGRYALLAEKASTRFMRIFGGKVQKGMTRAEARALACRHLKQVSKICGNHGCMPLAELHDAWNTSAAMMELLADFDPQEVGAIWDIDASYHGGEKPAQTLAGLGSYLRHVQVKDSKLMDGSHVPVLLGEGELPLQDLAQVLKSAGYDGWICLEAEKRWDPRTPDPEISIPQFARYMRRLLA